jgi:hypothetical protein
MQNDLERLALIMVQTDSKDCYLAGAIALRKYRDATAAFKYWRTAERCLTALEKAVETRMSLPADTKLDPVYGAQKIPARYFYYLLLCLLFNGDRARFARLRKIFDLPFVVLNGSNPKVPDSYAAETRLVYAAWEGDIQLVESFVSPLQLEYKRYRIAGIYTDLWLAVAQRNEVALNALLPEAEAAHKKAARRRDADMWGGDKDYNNAMFDTYTTSVLKIAKDVGMAWTYGNANTAELWPAVVMNKWSAGK